MSRVEIACHIQAVVVRVHLLLPHSLLRLRLGSTHACVRPGYTRPGSTSLVLRQFIQFLASCCRLTHPMHSLVHSLVPQCTSRHGGASRRSALSFRRATRTRVRASAVENGPVARDDGPVAALERSINTLVVGSSIAVLDAVYADSALLTSYARFFTLETIARVPYFGASQAESSWAPSAAPRHHAALTFSQPL